MKPRRLVISAAVASAAVALTVVLAAGLSTSTDGVGAAAASVTRCDSDGVTVLRTISGGSVTSVTVGGIASACATGNLLVTENNGSSTSSGGPVAIPAGGGTVSVTLGAALTATGVEDTQVMIVGP